MAAALYPSRNDAGSNLHAPGFSQALMTELDFRDNRYPAMPSHRTAQQQRSPTLPLDRPDLNKTGNSSGSARSSDPPASLTVDRPSPSESLPRPQPVTTASDPQSVSSQSLSLSQEQPSRGMVSYSLPPGTTRRVVERYSLEDSYPPQQPPSRGSEETRPTAIDLNTQDNAQAGGRSGVAQSNRQNLSLEPMASLPPSAPRHPSLPAAGIGAGPSDPNAANFVPAIMPLSASPNYIPPVSQRHRAYAQQPTYINQPTLVDAVNPVFSKVPQPPEEICIECAMRDQDMADVDVTSPGMWDRESDVLFEELIRREAEDEAAAVAPDETRPRSKGGKLTEQNLKIWMSVVRSFAISLCQLYSLPAHRRILGSLRRDR